MLLLRVHRYCFILFFGVYFGLLVFLFLPVPAVREALGVLRRVPCLGLVVRCH